MNNHNYQLEHIFLFGVALENLPEFIVITFSNYSSNPECSNSNTVTSKI